MFMLYSVVAGLGLGLLLRGRIARLGEVRLRWAPLAVAGLAVQVALFSAPVSAVIGAAGPVVYVISTAAVLAVVIANLRVPGLAAVAIGGISNLAAIVANGGYMPVSADALGALGLDPATDYSNSAAFERVALAPLTDVFATPAWLPFSNVFSIGDVIIGIGIVIAIVAAMRNPRLDPPATRSVETTAVGT